jgi:ligand-binding sensor domain-containing protein/serine phosphatase RsbU (regulator of sigma subunit)
LILFNKHYIKLRLKLKYLILILIFTSCKENHEKNALESLQQITQSNLETNYYLNPITGDSIETIITEDGDTLISGIPLNLKGENIILDNTFESKEKNLVLESISIVDLKKHIIPDELIVSIVNKKSLTRTFVEDSVSDDNKNFILNSYGDTIKTGQSIPVKGKKLSTTYPNPILAVSPQFKDAAFNNLKYLDVDHGLSSSFILSILEDKNGNMWFGTDGGGISKYDGTTFYHFTKKNGLKLNTVRSIIQDKKGNIWFGTDNNGVNMYDGEGFSEYTEKEGLISNKIRTLFQDIDSNIWIGSWGGGLTKFDGDSFTHFTKKEGLASNMVTSIVQGKDGLLYFGTFEGLSIYNGKSFISYSKKNGLVDNGVYSVLEDREGRIWIGTYGGGVSLMRNDSITNFSVNEGLCSDKIFSIVEDKSGNIWFGTDGGGLSMYDGKSFTTLTENEGLVSNRIYASYKDSHENLWFGTIGGGVNILNNNSFTHLNKNKYSKYNDVRSIIEDNNGNIWLVSGTNGASKFDGEKHTYFNFEDHNSILSIIEDDSNNIWFGTWGGGINKYDGKTLTNYSIKDGLVSNNIWSMLQDSDGFIWLGTYDKGIMKFDGESFIHFSVKDGLHCNMISDIKEDKNGNIWFASYNGVSKYDGKSFTHLTEKEGLGNNHVSSIKVDKNGNIFFATSGGVSILNEKQINNSPCFLNECDHNLTNDYELIAHRKEHTQLFSYLTEKDGLSSNKVRSIIEDNNGDIWLGTNKGLTQIIFEDKLSLSQNNEDLKMVLNKPIRSVLNYSTKDGLKGVNFSSAAIIDSQNRIWWGTEKSVTMLDLNNFSNLNETLIGRLRQVTINNQFIDYREESAHNLLKIRFDSIEPFENYPHNLKLPYDKNHINFYFSTIELNSQHNIKYSYILEGLDENWSEANSEANAEYRNLSHGNYTFKFRTIGKSNIWSESVDYNFVILPPIWLTWWAKISYGIGSLFLVFGFVKWRVYNLKKRQTELEMEIKIATKEITDQKEQVEVAHKEITDSINYAARIQYSFLATKELLDSNLNDYFVFFKPKGTVSGDFYWAGILKNGNFAIVNADSTGHGVPGAIMSILNISSIEESIKEGLLLPHEIFNKTRKFIIDRLKKDGSATGGKDGMDASLICFNFNESKFSYVAAQNPIWIIRDKELIEIKPERMPIGKHDNDQVPFIGGEFDMKKGDQIYTLTDGFQDQFGGPRGKKFMIKKMREYVLSISHLSMAEQQQEIKETFTNWKGDFEQVDDVCVIGVRI